MTDNRYQNPDKIADICVVGGGPAGLQAAIVARELGGNVLIVDDNPILGGQLIKQTHKFFGSKLHYCGVRGIDIATILGGDGGGKGNHKTRVPDPGFVQEGGPL